MSFEEDIRAAVECLRSGGLILYPTDTIWGIGCDATNDEAVKKVFQLKKRAEVKSMLSLVGSVAELERYVDDIPDVAFELIDSAVNPLTIIYSHPRGIANGLLAADGSAAFRITGERYSREICRRLRKPIVSTSANISGTKAPAIFREISSEITEGVDYVAEYRRDDTCHVMPSEIIKLGDGGLISIVRQAGGA